MEGCVVGLRDKYAKRDAEQGFEPLELTEGNVQAIFNRCLKTAETKEIEYATLFREDLGYEKTEIPVHFDKKRLKTNEKAIRYMFGQLAVVHKGKFTITEDEGTIKYDGSRWTANSGIRAMLLHIAAGAHIMTPFVAKEQRAGLIKLSPTLSPKDPNFPAWWEAHKAEWEDNA